MAGKTKTDLEKKVAELQAKLEAAEAGVDVDGIRSALAQIEKVKLDARAENHGIIDRCINAVRQLIPEGAEEPEQPEEPDSDGSGGDGGSTEADGDGSDGEGSGEE